MPEIASIADIIRLWPSRQVLANDLSEEMASDVSLHRVNKWAEKGAIPAWYHHAILCCARRRHLPVDADLLVLLHARLPLDQRVA